MKVQTNLRLDYQTRKTPGHLASPHVIASGTRSLQKFYASAPESDVMCRLSDESTSVDALRGRASEPHHTCFVITPFGTPFDRFYHEFPFSIPSLTVNIRRTSCECKASRRPTRSISVFVLPISYSWVSIRRRTDPRPGKANFLLGPRLAVLAPRRRAPVAGGTARTSCLLTNTGR